MFVRRTEQLRDHSISVPGSLLDSRRSRGRSQRGVEVHVRLHIKSVYRQEDITTCAQQWVSNANMAGHQGPNALNTYVTDAGSIAKAHRALRGELRHARLFIPAIRDQLRQLDAANMVQVLKDLQCKHRADGFQVLFFLKGPRRNSIGRGCCLIRTGPARSRSLQESCS